MNRYTPRKSAEFEARQYCFDFGDACRFVAALANDVKKTLATWVKRLFARPDTSKKPHQLVLELDSIAQIPLFLAHE